MRTLLTSLAAALIVAITAFSSQPANAGNNVKLQFGGALGSFNATGNGKHKSKGYSAKKHAPKCGKHCRAKLAKKRYLAKKKAAAKRKAMAAAKAKARRKAIAAKKREQARRRAIANAKARSKAAKDNTQTADKDQADDDTTTTAETTTDKSAVNVSALAAINKPLDQVVDKDKKKTKDGEEVSTIETGTTQSDNEAEDDLASENSCKKFVASAGMTITVPCEDAE